MASLRKRLGSPYWYLNWHEFPGNKGRRDISTGIRHNNARQPPRDGTAWEILRAKEDELARRKHGLPVSVKDVEVAPFLVRHLHWLRTTSGDISESTLIRYQSVVSVFTRWITTHNLPTFSRFSHDHISRFVMERAAAKSSKTVAMDCDFLAQVWDSAKDHSHVIFEQNPWRKVRPASVKSKKRRALTPAESVFVLQHLADLQPWEAYTFITALYTGARLTSIVRLPRSHVDRQRNLISFPDEIVKSKPYTVPIHPLLLQFLDGYDGGDKTHFVTADIRDRAANYPDRMVNSYFAHWRELASRDQAPGFLDGITFHCLRHTFVTGIALSGGTKRESQLLAGHASAAINDAYTHVEAEALAPVVQRLAYPV